MAGEGIDYATATTMVLNFICISIILQSAFFPASLYSDQLELKDTAERASKNVLSLLSSDGGFGYTLDPQIVSMLDTDNPFSRLSYEELLSQLNLEDYDFQLRLSPLIDVEVSRVGLNWSQPEFLVRVTDGGVPLSDILVEAIIVYIKEKSDIYATYSFLAQAEYTSTLGEVTINKTAIPEGAEDYVILFHIDTGEVDTYLVCYDIDSGQIFEIRFYGDRIWIRLSEKPERGTAWVHNLVGLIGSDIVPLYNSTGGDEDKITWSITQTEWWNQSLKGIDEITMVFVASKSGGRGWIEVGFPYMPLLVGKDGITFGKDTSKQKTMVSRTMTISKLLYKVDFLLWRKK
ncbi:MAG: hypothetical protein ACE5GD_01525 [Candidatus Geothermarchaeales archaeon]